MRNLIVVAVIVLVVGLPFLFRPEAEFLEAPDRTLVIITPHNETIRSEFERGFRRWYRERTGEVVEIDWRVIGGTSEIVRFVNSTYLGRFRNYWTNELGRAWSVEVRDAFNNPSIELPDDPAEDDLAQAARRAFLESEVGCGLDIFFGGGSFEFRGQAAAGHLIPWRAREEAASILSESSIPQHFAGEDFYDPERRWVGAVLSTFGIIYNQDALRRLEMDEVLRHWPQLADPRLFGEVALADPSMSGSMGKSFEMILQQRMQEAVRQEGKAVDGEVSEDLLAEGWLEGMRLIQRVAANARYFTDSATKPTLDVSKGDSAAGMSIDFYGRFQSEILRARSGSARFHFHAPIGGSSVSADPIALFRGAPNADLASDFIDFVLSMEGQKLWGYRVGTPGGPERFALRRSPIRMEMYGEEHLPYLSEPEINPYRDAADFVYRSDWTGPLFTPLRFIIRVCFIDTHRELTRAWGSILEARKRGDRDLARRAEDHFDDLLLVNYHQAWETIRPVLRAGEKIDELQLARHLSDSFRKRYREVEAIASGRAAVGLQSYLPADGG